MCTTFDGFLFFIFFLLRMENTGKKITLHYCTIYISSKKHQYLFRLVENLFRGPKFHDILDQINNSEYISNCTILNLKQSDKAKARTNLISKIPTSETSCCGSVIITSSTSGNCLMWTMITLDRIVNNYVWIMLSLGRYLCWWTIIPRG
jgi:hypothetical protein